MSEQHSSFDLYLWILTVCLSPVVRGQVHVLGDSELVRAHVGSVVVLPCRCDPPVDLTPLTVEWSRAELRPDPSDRLKRVPFVHVYTDHHDDDPDMKIPEFTKRTQLFLGQLATGVASLQISNLTLSDNGTYKCFIPNLRTEWSLRWTHITLSVEAFDAAPTHTPDPRLLNEDSAGDPTISSERSQAPKAAIFGVVVLFVIVAAVFYFRKNRWKPTNEASFPHSALQCPEGGDSAMVRQEDVKLIVD